jgi:hypothetical protein
MKHNWLRLFDSEGNWHGAPDHTIRINGETHDVYEYAKKHGIQIPTAPNTPNKPKKTKKVNIDIEENSYGDMEQTHSSESVEEHGDGDSESTE